MTTDEAKAIVLAKYPAAESDERQKGWFIREVTTDFSGIDIVEKLSDYCKTADAAWISAARRIVKGRVK